MHNANLENQAGINNDAASIHYCRITNCTTQNSMFRTSARHSRLEQITGVMAYLVLTLKTAGSQRKNIVTYVTSITLVASIHCNCMCCCSIQPYMDLQPFHGNS